MPKQSKKLKPSWVPKREKHQRLVDNSKFYNSTAWRKFAKHYKQRNPVCVMCSKENRVGPADVADHIIRIEDGGEKFNENNIQSLCNFHHNRKSGKEGNVI